MLQLQTSSPGYSVRREHAQLKSKSSSARARSLLCHFHASSSAGQTLTAKVRLPANAPPPTQRLQDETNAEHLAQPDAVEQLATPNPDNANGTSAVQGALDPEAADLLANWAESYQLPDEMSLWDDGDYYSSRRDIATAYSPPTSDLPGLASALGLITAWACLFKHAIWGFDLFGELSLLHVLDGVVTFAALEFVSTGLFITTRECFVGICSSNDSKT